MPIAVRHLDFDHRDEANVAVGGVLIGTQRVGVFRVGKRRVESSLNLPFGVVGRPVENVA